MVDCATLEALWELDAVLIWETRGVLKGGEGWQKWGARPGLAATVRYRSASL